MTTAIQRVCGIAAPCAHPGLLGDIEEFWLDLVARKYQAPKSSTEFGCQRLSAGKVGRKLLGIDALFSTVEMAVGMASQFLPRGIEDLLDKRSGKK
jgi:hypothetical protein